MKGKFEAYLLWPVKEKLISWLLTCVSARGLRFMIDLWLEIEKKIVTSPIQK